MKILMCLEEEEAPGGRCFQMVVSFLVVIISHKEQEFRRVQSPSNALIISDFEQSLLILLGTTGRARLIRTRLIRSST